MSEEKQKNENPAVPGKSTIVKNILYLVFITLVIIYCFGKYRESNRYKAFNNARDIYDNAHVLAANGDGASLAEFAAARDMYQKIYDSTRKDPELNVDAEDMLAKTYASMSGCPQVPARLVEAYMLLALETCGACPLVGDEMRAIIANMTDEEKAAARKFACEEEARLLKEDVARDAVPAEN